MRLRRASPELKDRARSLRRGSTDAEALLWRHLRGRNLAGARFRRERPIGPYIVDFYCPERGLIIELDGGQHSLRDQAAYDAERTAYLVGYGLTVLRFTDRDALQKTQAVMEAILRAVSPSP
jgi:adenine-specific DNA-methyltransferase